MEKRFEDAASDHIYIFLGCVSISNQIKDAKLTSLRTICYANIKPSMNHAQLVFNILCKFDLLLFIELY